MSKKCSTFFRPVFLVAKNWLIFNGKMTGKGVFLLDYPPQYRQCTFCFALHTSDILHLKFRDKKFKCYLVSNFDHFAVVYVLASVITQKSARMKEITPFYVQICCFSRVSSITLKQLPSVKFGKICIRIFNCVFHQYLYFLVCLYLYFSTSVESLPGRPAICQIG